MQSYNEVHSTKISKNNKNKMKFSAFVISNACVFVILDHFMNNMWYQ